MKPILSSLSARLLFIASIAIAIPVVGALFAMTLLGTAALGLIAWLQAPRQRHDEHHGPLVIDGEYTVVEARTVPLRAPYRR